MKELIQKIEQWAAERNLLHIENAEKQYLKFIEEVGETTRSILNQDRSGVIDGFGDTAITIIILAKQLKISLRTEFVGYSQFKTTKFSWFVRRVAEDTVSENILEYLNDVSSSYGYTLEDCLNSAWSEIKHRKGKTINGTFIKESELNQDNTIDVVGEQSIESY